MFSENISHIFVQVGILAAAGLYALDHQVDKLADDHKHAKTIANVINTSGKNRFKVIQYQGRALMIML